MFFFFKQKTAYELRISDWSSDVCSSDLSYQITFKSISDICADISGAIPHPIAVGRIGLGGERRHVEPARKARPMQDRFLAGAQRQGAPQVAAPAHRARAPVRRRFAAPVAFDHAGFPREAFHPDPGGAPPATARAASEERRS